MSGGICPPRRMFAALDGSRCICARVPWYVDVFNAGIKQQKLPKDNRRLHVCVCASIKPSSILLWTCYQAFAGRDWQQDNLGKNRLLTSIKVDLVILQYSRLMVMSWNNVMPPPGLPCSAFINARVVTDVVCHLESTSPCVCVFMYLWILLCVHATVRSGGISHAI